MLSNQSLLPFLSRFDGENQGFAWELEEQQWRRERGEHWCSVTVGSKKDDVNGTNDRYSQEERIFIPQSSSG